MKKGPVGLNKFVFYMTICHDKVGATLYLYIYNNFYMTRAY